MRIAVPVIDSRDHGTLGIEVSKANRQRARRAFYLRSGIVPNHQSQRAILFARQQSGIRINLQPLIPNLVKKFERSERGLWNTVFRQKAESAIERGFRNSLFVEDVGERPVRHDIYQSIALTNRIGKPR